ncbi:MAG TPA: class I SAM-dependent methyltransferase, partial [Longimicrobium sp.]
MSTTVQAFYDANVEREWERLDLPLCRVEMASTLRLIERWFPAGAEVLDAGSGPGRYALELARRGFRVTLADLSPGLLDRARQAFAQAGLRAEGFHAADAREL